MSSERHPRRFDVDPDPAIAHAGPSRLMTTRQSSLAIREGPSFTPAPNPRLSRLLSRISQIRKLDEDSIEHKRERRVAMRQREKDRKTSAAGETESVIEGSKGEAGKACTACKKTKTKCLSTGAGVCVRCQTSGEVCEYPQQRKRGRKTNTSIQSLLDELEDELQTIFRDPSSVGNRSSSPSRTQFALPDIPDVRVSTHAALHNPLGVLASAAAAAPDRPLEDTVQIDGSYWNNMYSVKPETDFSVDPVLRGLISEAEVDLLVSFYFRNLRPYFMHLDRLVHTPTFLRINSPFLTTALCAIASSFHPSTCSLVFRLTTHAHHLAATVFANGNKSLEIVQAFLILSQWGPAPIGQDRMEDRSWQYQGQAMRLACEIRLDLPMDREYVSMYKVETRLGEEAVDRLLACRKRSYLLVCLSEIAMATQSGRADTTSGHRLLKDPMLPSSFADDPINEPFKAYIVLNHIFARSLHQWHGTDKDAAGTSGREEFGRIWERPLKTWKKDWMGRYRAVDVHSVNTHIMLILLSLRIPGSDTSTQTLLRQICELAVQLIVIVQKWYDETDFWAPGGLAYAHNFLIINIAYGAVLVHKLASLTGTDRVAEVSTRIERIAVILDQIAAGRMNANSFAGFYATQLRALTSTPKPYLPPIRMSPHTTVPTQPLHGQFDFSFLPFESSGLSVGLHDGTGINGGIGLGEGGDWDATLMDPIFAAFLTDPETREANESGQ